MDVVIHQGKRNAVRLPDVSITDGSSGPIVVNAPFRGGMTPGGGFQLPVASGDVKRFASARYYVVAAQVLGLLSPLVMLAGIVLWLALGFDDGFLVWWPLFVGGLLLGAASPLVVLVSPRQLPRVVGGGDVLIRRVNVAAAQAWVAANPPGVVTSR